MKLLQYLPTLIRWVGTIVPIGIIAANPEQWTGADPTSLAGNLAAIVAARLAAAGVSTQTIQRLLQWLTRFSSSTHAEQSRLPAESVVRTNWIVDGLSQGRDPETLKAYWDAEWDTLIDDVQSTTSGGAA